MSLTTHRLRQFVADHPEFDLLLPIKAGQTIYAGAACELNGGYLEVASEGGTFGGFALDGSLAIEGEADGARSVKCRVLGGIELDITTETPLQADVGLATTQVEATDDDTFRIERDGAPIDGVPIGSIVRLVGPTRVAVSFRGSMIA